MSIKVLYVLQPTAINGKFELDAVWVPGANPGKFVNANLPPGVYRIPNPEAFAKQNPNLAPSLVDAGIKGGGLPDPPGAVVTLLQGQNTVANGAAVKTKIQNLLAGQGGPDGDLE
jgi:hypothetical protein